MKFSVIFFVSIAALLLSAVSYLYLDAPIAIWIDENIRSHAGFHAYTSDIPDFLPLSVIVISAFSWAGYWYLRSAKIFTEQRYFFLVVGLVLPLSFVVKTLLKLVFGRIETRIWLTDHSLDGMHWFGGGDGLDGFPSGHTLVYITLFFAFWQFYPKYRFLYLVGLISMAIALILTNYHFLSDVISGAYFGWVVYGAVNLAVIARQRLSHA